MTFLLFKSNLLNTYIYLLKILKIKSIIVLTSLGTFMRSLNGHKNKIHLKIY